MRLINADRLILEYDCYGREWLRIRADRIDTVTVEAIPIERILKWACKFIDPNSDGYKMAMELLHDWRKENEESN